MLRRAACAFASVIMIIAGTCATAFAQVPDAQALQRDLGGTYTTTRPTLSLKSNGEIARRVEKILQKQSQFLVSQLHPWDANPQASLLTDGRFNEAGIRPNAHAAYGFAVLARTTDDRAARDHALKILRFLLPTHAKWKDQWQSALWATSAGQAAWLLWDDLDDRQKWLAARMICHEADRFVDAVPPARVERDTKAEENAWNSQVLALAFNMFPKHPSRDRYRDAAVRWQLSSFATARDVENDEVVEGKPLREWLAGAGANLHDDYTLENHDRVHPDYMSSTRTLVTQTLFYEWAGNAPPASLHFNVKPVYANLKRLALPDGGFVYPNAQDWHLRRNADWFDAHAAVAILRDDAQAARLMRLCLETAEKMIARSNNGGIYAAGETIFPSSQAMLLELYADAYLLLRARGEGPEPVGEKKLWRDLAGVHRFDAGRFVVVRTDRSVATFSYGRQVMGMVLPLRKDLLLAPNDRGLIGVGAAAADGKPDKPRLVQWELIDAVGDFLAVTGELHRADGALSQRFAFVALSDGRAVYADFVSPLRADLPPRGKTFTGGTLGVLNDRNWVYHDGVRTLHHAGGSTDFAAAKEADFRAVDLTFPWYNLDDALGIVCLATSGTQVYHEQPTPGARGRREQLFHLNANSPLPASSAIVFYPAHSAEKTRAAAERCRLITGRDPLQFSILLDDGKRLDFDLNRFNVESP